MNLLALILLTLVSVCPAEQNSLNASKAWVKAPAAGATSTEAFVVVENPTMYDVYVVSASADVAGSVTFEKPGATPGAIPQVVSAITAPAYGFVELKPEGVHLVLSSLSKPLTPGDSITITLTTDNGLELTVAANVKQN